MDNETKDEFKKIGEDFKNLGKDMKDKFESQEWKEKMDNFGKKMEEKGEEVGEQIKKKVEDKVSKPCARRFGYVIAVVINIVMFYVVNNLLNWDLQFVKASWLNVIGIFNLSIILNIVIYFLYIGYDKRMFYFGGKFVLDIMSILVMYQLFIIMPFDFNGLYELGWLNNIFPIIMIIGIIGTIIGSVVRIFKFIANKNIYY